jgi:hypothetical protein
MEVLETQPIIELMNGTFGYNPRKYHQDQIAAYWTSSSSKDVAFLYLKHKALCRSYNSIVINCFVCLLNN